MPYRPGTRLGTYLWSDLLTVDEEYEEAVTAVPDLSSQPAPRIQEPAGSGPRWRAVADCLQEPERSDCRELARVADQAAV